MLLLKFNWSLFALKIVTAGDTKIKTKYIKLGRLDRQNIISFMKRLAFITRGR